MLTTTVVKASNEKNVPHCEKFWQGVPVSLSLQDKATVNYPDTGEWEIEELLDWNVKRFGHQVKKGLGDAIAFVNEDGQLWQVSVENAPFGRDGKRMKYIAPVGAGSLVYMPALDEATILKVEERNGVVVDRAVPFWTWVANSNVALVITEGGKKSLALLEQGFVAVSLYGVNAFMGVRNGAKKPLTPQLEWLLQNDRVVTIAYDQDTKQETRYRVMSATGFLVSAIKKQAVSTVKVAGWYPGEGGDRKGIDDLIAWNESIGCEAIAEAPEAGFKSALHHMKGRTTREVQVPVGNNEFVEALDFMNKSGIVVLLGAKGTGKTKAIAAIVKRAGGGQEASFLSISHLRTLSRDHAARLGGTFYQETALSQQNRVTICTPSLAKLNRKGYNVLVLDEVMSVFESIFCSSLCGKGQRQAIIAALRIQIKSADLVVLADADMEDKAIEFVEEIRGEEGQAQIVQSTRLPLRYQAIVPVCKGQQFLDLMVGTIIDNAAKPVITYVSTDTKQASAVIGAVLNQRGAKTLTINADTINDPLIQGFILGGGDTIPDLIEAGYRAIVASPSITQGFSLSKEVHLIDSVWGYYTGKSLVPESIAQALDRVRDHRVTRYLWIADQGTARSRHSLALDTKSFKEEFKAGADVNVALVRAELAESILWDTEAVDYAGANIDMFAHMEVRRNQGMLELKQRVLAILTLEGKFVDQDPALKQIVCYKDAFKNAKEAIKFEEAEAIATADKISDAQAALWGNASTLTKQQQDQLTRWHYENFYKDDADVDGVIWDRKGRARKQIRLVEQLFDNDLAIASTANSIARNAMSPQDYDKSALVITTLEQSGVAELMRDIILEKVLDDQDDRFAELADHIRHNQGKYAAVWGTRKLEFETDYKVLSIAFNLIGLKARRLRRQETNVFDIQINYAKHLEVIKRRGQVNINFQFEIEIEGIDLDQYEQEHEEVEVASFDQDAIGSGHAEIWNAPDDDYNEDEYLSSPD